MPPNVMLHFGGPRKDVGFLFYFVCFFFPYHFLDEVALVKSTRSVKDSLIHDGKAVTAINQIIDTAVSRLFNDLLSQSVHFSKRGDTLGIWLERCYGHFHWKETLRLAPYGIALHILFLSENLLSFLNKIAGPASQTGTKRRWGWRHYIEGQLH